MNWNEYEKAVYEECQRVFLDTVITFDDHVDGIYSKRKRQIDVLIKNYQGKTIAVDAKKYNKKVDVKTVESFISMTKDIGADLGILVSEGGFTKTAINRAHLGDEGVEVDILSLEELKLFQDTGAIPYSGNCAVVMKSPFGWIIDGTRRESLPATLYQRGLSFEEATESKEWAYFQFYDKKSEDDTIQNLVEFQNRYLMNEYRDGKIIISDDDDILIRQFQSREYPTIETTLYRDLGNFILFIVLFCPDNVMSRDIEKMKYVLRNAIPITFRH
jgi:hypothetical protein